MKDAPSSPLAAQAVAGIASPALAAAVAAHWELLVTSAPTYATTLGDHRFDDRLAMRDAAAIAHVRAARAAILAQLAAIDPLSLAPTDRATHALLAQQLAADADVEACAPYEWTVDAGGASLVGELAYLVEGHPVATAADARNVVTRLAQAPALVDQTIDHLLAGLARGRVAGAEKVRRAIAQLDTELAAPPETWAMANPAWAAAHPAEHAALVAIARDRIAPAFTRLRDALRDRIAPAARTELEGLSGLPADYARAYYAAAIRLHTGLALSADDIHAIGLREIARSDAAIAALGARALGTPDLPQAIARLRGDPVLYFTTGAEILAAAQAALDRARAAVPRFFADPPATDCVMREIPAYEAPYTYVAYYRQPHFDGSKPGEYFVNTHAPATRARFELEALTWHESIPGHHLQIARAQELGAALPMFRKLDGSTAFVEGWALYTEVLAEEMGLYTSDLDRIGQASFAAWRAARLVVDTGLHALGWTRARAEQFMREHTALTETNISNEVDRYIGWPGQALAYKLGQLAILALRAEAEAALGAAFDLRAFHTVVLDEGAVTIPVLEANVRAWIAARASRP